MGSSSGDGTGYVPAEVEPEAGGAGESDSGDVITGDEAGARSEGTSNYNYVMSGHTAEIRDYSDESIKSLRGVRNRKPPKVQTYDRMGEPSFLYMIMHADIHVGNSI